MREYITRQGSRNSINVFCQIHKVTIQRQIRCKLRRYFITRRSNDILFKDDRFHFGPLKGVTNLNILQANYGRFCVESTTRIIVTVFKRNIKGLFRILTSRYPNFGVNIFLSMRGIMVPVRGDLSLIFRRVRRFLFCVIRGIRTCGSVDHIFQGPVRSFIRILRSIPMRHSFVGRTFIARHFVMYLVSFIRPIP